MERRKFPKHRLRQSRTSLFTQGLAEGHQYHILGKNILTFENKLGVFRRACERSDLPTLQPSANVSPRRAEKTNSCLDPQLEAVEITGFGISQQYHAGAHRLYRRAESSRKKSSAATGSSRCAHAKRPSNGQSGRPCPTTRGSKSARFTRCLTFPKTSRRRRKGSSN